MEQRDPMRRVFLNGDDGRLCCVDFGGTGRPMLLLHGLAGRSNEWRETASWLTTHGHVVALGMTKSSGSQPTARAFRSLSTLATPALMCAPTPRNSLRLPWANSHDDGTMP